MIYLLCKNKEVLSLDLFLLGSPNCQCPQIFPLRWEGLVSPEADAPTSYLERHPLLYVTWPDGERDGRFTTQMQTLFNTSCHSVPLISVLCAWDVSGTPCLLWSHMPYIWYFPFSSVSKDVDGKPAFSSSPPHPSSSIVQILFCFIDGKLGVFLFLFRLYMGWFLRKEEERNIFTVPCWNSKAMGFFSFIFLDQYKICHWLYSSIFLPLKQQTHNILGVNIDYI